MDPEDAFILFAYQGQTHLVPRPPTYTAALELAKSEFALLDGARIALSVNWKGRRANISEKAFGAVAHAEEVFVTARPPLAASGVVRHVPAVRSTPRRPYDRPELSEEKIDVEIAFYGEKFSRKSLTIKIKLNIKAERLICAISDQEGICKDSFYLMYEDKRVGPDDLMSSIGIQHGETIFAFARLTGGKPVIYIQPPHDLEHVSVKLSLSREWDYSAVYPVVEPKSEDGRSVVHWDVAAKASGELTDKVSGLNLSYLFWEATSVSGRPPTPSYDGESAGFDPSSPSLAPSNAAVLAFTPFLKHLDHALTSLGLHVSARNDFITFWLPHFVRIHESSKVIAFRFLPQADYEQTARLDVTPAPEVITRVFLLFGGVDSAKEAWSEACSRAENMDWKKVVGVRDEVTDATKFRVLESGGMEVSCI